MKRKITVLLLALIIALPLLSSCTNRVLSDSNVLVGDDKKSVFIGDFMYELPRDWSTIKDDYDSYMNFAPDNIGVFYASRNSWSPMDLTDKDNIELVLNKTFDNFIQNFSNVSLSSQERGTFKNKESLESYFNMEMFVRNDNSDLVSGPVHCYSLIFISGSNAYSFTFIFPDDLKGEMEEMASEIIASII